MVGNSKKKGDEPNEEGDECDRTTKRDEWGRIYQRQG